MVVGTTTCVNCSQFEKAATPMAVTELGISTILMDVQFANAYDAIVVSLEGRVTNELFPQDVQSLH